MNKTEIICDIYSMLLECLKNHKPQIFRDNNLTVLEYSSSVFFAGAAGIPIQCDGIRGTYKNFQIEIEENLDKYRIDFKISSVDRYNTTLEILIDRTCKAFTKKFLEEMQIELQKYIIYRV